MMEMARRLVENHGIRTTEQKDRALCFMAEQLLAQEERKFQLRQEKKKAKHRGH